MGKEKSGIQHISSVLPIIGLALLMLLSPCKVKNYFQANFGVAQTTVINKSQTALSQIDCRSTEVSELIEVTTKREIKHPHFFIPETTQITFPVDLSSATSGYLTPRKYPVFFVPLYILYQKLKVYL
jgi:hypothetical protein